jgi:hypothetical protein
VEHRKPNLTSVTVTHQRYDTATPIKHQSQTTTELIANSVHDQTRVPGQPSAAKQKTPGRRLRIPSIEYAVVKEHRETRPARPKTQVRRGRRLVGAGPRCVNAITLPAVIFRDFP